MGSVPDRLPPWVTTECTLVIRTSYRKGHCMHWSARFLSWIAALALVFVLCGLGAFEVVTQVESSGRLRAATAATRLSSAYSDARFNVARVGEAANVYVQSPTPENLAILSQRWDVALASANDIRRLGGPDDIKLVNSLEDPARLANIQAYFANIANGQPVETPGPYANWSTELVNALSGPQQLEAARAENALAQNAAWSDTRTRISVAVFAGGVILVLALVVVERLLARREAEVEIEMRRLRTVAISDPLTGLGNRRAFEEAFNRTDSSGGQALALAMIDLDEFKAINDTWGHNRGDATLRDVAEALRGILPSSASAFRIGGDEFAAFLPGIETDEALAVMEKFRGWVARELAPASVSIGLVARPAGESDQALLCQQADSALYQAKHRGRNVVVPYAAGLESEPVFPASKIHAMHRLLTEGRVHTVFQPIWHLSPRTLLGYEALTRLDPGYEIDGPQEAFDIAQQLGHVAELDAICRRSTIAAALALPPDALLFMNVSPHSFVHGDLTAAALLDELATANLSPQRVVIEITERTVVAPAVVAEAAAGLRAAGFAIALDDVGAGNIGFAMLQQVPFDYLKVDREIVIGAQLGGSARAALRALLVFGAEVGAQVLVEGVETQAQMTFVEQMAGYHLRAHGATIQLVQGYLLGEPAAGFPASHAEAAAA